MITDKDLYISDSLKSKYKSIVTKLRHGKLVTGLFVIVLNENTGRPEVMKSVYFCQKALHRVNHIILGLTDSYDDAILYLAKRVAAGYDADVIKEKSWEFDLC